VVDRKSLQRFAGKTTSFAIAVPAARLYTRACYRIIGSNSNTPNKPIKVAGDLQKEICYWRLLDSWEGHLPRFDERHRVFSSFSDASNSGWGAVIRLEPGETQLLRDYWHPDDLSQPIVIREALALRNTLIAAGHLLQGSRVDGHVDSLPLVHAWKNQGSKSNALSEVIKSVYETTLHFNIALSISYVPSKGNIADAPSRALSHNDCMLTISAWKQLEARWGPHSIDLMSLDSNVQKGVDGQPLPHFTPWPTKNSSCLNVFAQSLDSQANVYVSPPLVLVGPVLRFLASGDCSVTFVVIKIKCTRLYVF
jgi:hypothetical protein